MSLINEALKKAQKQRQDEAAGNVPSSGGVEPPPPPPPLAPPAAAPEPQPDPIRQMRRSRSSGGLVRNGLIGAGVLIAGTVVWWGLGDSDADDGEEDSVLAPTIAQTPPVVTPPTVSDVKTESAVTEPPAAVSTEPEIKVVFPSPTASVQDVEVKKPAAKPVPVSTRETKPAVTPSTTGALTKAQVQSPVAQPMPQPVVPAPPPSTTTSAAIPVLSRETAQPATSGNLRMATPGSAPQGGVLILQESAPVQSTVVQEGPAQGGPDPMVLSFLESAKVTGVRASATDPKVLMNNRVFRMNDVVDQSLQLRITGIAPRELKFTDGAGYVYTKSF